MKVRAALVLVLALAMGCGSTEQRLDPRARWRAAERRRVSALRSLEQVRRVRNDYEAVTALARDGDLRARSFLRLAELDIAMGNCETAHDQLVNALRSGASAELQRGALLALGDLFDRRMGAADEARKTYAQIIAEHPNTPEAELAEWRLEGLSHEQ